MGTQRERAFFGGWKTSQLAAGTLVWGTPEVRCLEVRNTSVGGKVELPNENSDRFQAGVPYYVFNLKSANDANNYDLPVVDQDGTTIGTVAVGASDDTSGFGEFVWAGEWIQVESGVGDFQGAELAVESYTIELVGNYACLNIYDRAVAAGYNGEEDCTIIVNINTGSVVGSTAQNLPAITTDVASKWGAGCRVVLNIYDSYIIGWGGTGGDGADVITTTTATVGGDGQNGGDCIHCYIDTHINNVRSHVSGGGGGGGGGGAKATVNVSTGLGEYHGGDGGGGGRGANMNALGDLIGSTGGARGVENPNLFGGTLDGISGSHLSPGGSQAANLWTDEGGQGGNRGGWDSATAPEGVGSTSGTSVGGITSTAGGAAGLGGVLVNKAGSASVTYAFIALVNTSVTDPLTGQTIVQPNGPVSYLDTGFCYSGTAYPADTLPASATLSTL